MPATPADCRRGLLRGAANLTQLARTTVGCRMYRGHWLPVYLRNHRPFDARSLRRDTPIEVVVVIVDHFEPGERHGPDAAIESVSTWCETYKQLASRHRDADGRPPQHTWFHRSEYRNLGCIQVLADYAYQGYGEVEFHLHHGHDTHESFAAKLQSGLAWFNQTGAMLTSEARPRQRFAYIAGNSALDNGAGDDSKSGCNTEIAALRAAGCYADFTFPALGSRAQPRTTNAIYYATDDPGPKSYDTGVDVKVGRPPSGDLMIFQGPSVVDWAHGRYETAELEIYAPMFPDRLDAWLRAHVHVKGRPEWIFVKLCTHGMQNRREFLGPRFDPLISAMVSRWNRPPFRLHFASAREAYNMVKAAEAGMEGDPNDFRDYDVPPPANTRIRCDAPWQLLTHEPTRVSLEVEGPGPTTIEFASGPLRSVRGRIRQLDARFSDGAVVGLDLKGNGEFQIDAAHRLGGVATDERFVLAGESQVCDG